MSTAELLLTAFVILCALATAGAQAAGRRKVVYLLKPLTTLLILILSTVAPEPVSRFYQTAVAVRLGFSIGGDALLMFPQTPRRIMLGGVCFLFAHLVYLPALATIAGVRVSPVLVIPFAFYAGVWIIGLWSRMDAQLRWPVAVYTVVLVSTGWLAAEQLIQFPDSRVALILVAMLLFIVSDSVLAFERFVKRGIGLEPLVMVLYFTAQLLTALTV